MMQDLNHKHILVTASDLRNPPKTAALVEQWLIDLVQIVEMQILMGPFAIRCTDEGNEGVTGVIVISTSHASIHIWDTGCDPFLKMDLYSCKDFDPEDVINHMEQFLPASVDWIVVDRNVSEMPVIQQGRKQF